MLLTLIDNMTLLANNVHQPVNLTGGARVEYFVNVSDVLQGKREQGTSSERETGSTA